jgi:putative SOS response-associated peptidase YedK
MCGRLYLTLNPDQLREYFKIEKDVSIPTYTISYNISPTNPLLVLN